MATNRFDNASLRISSSMVSSEQMTEMLQMSPTTFYEAGDPISRNRSTTKVRTNSLWLLEVKSDAQQGLEECIRKILDVCETKIEVLDTLKSSCDVDIFCGFSVQNGQGGIFLEQDVIARLAHLHIDIFFDIYAEEARQLP